MPRSPPPKKRRATRPRRFGPAGRRPVPLLAALRMAGPSRKWAEDREPALSSEQGGGDGEGGEYHQHFRPQSAEEPLRLGKHDEFYVDRHKRRRVAYPHRGSC